jgi:hypothetical protein
MPRKADIVRTFEEYNFLLFGGRLTLPDIMVRKMKRDYARWYEPDGTHPAGLLVLDSSRHQWTWRSTLLHEMCHIAVPEDSDEHGSAFIAEANRVGAIIGLEPCDPGSGWTWPSHALVHGAEETDMFGD